MYFMNQWEIEEAASRYRTHSTLGPATRFLHAFMEDVNSHSDGWAYWRLPINAAKQLMQLIASARTNPDAVTEEAIKKALKPIKSFYTRRGNAAGMTMPTL